MPNVVKARYWTAVLYPESMIDNWELHVADILQHPCCYCVHDKDLNNKFSEHRKTHVHFVIAFPNTTTYNSVLKLFKKLSSTCSYVEEVINIRYIYDYLIHDTDTCKKQNKYLYSTDERIELNNFDIGSYVQISKQERMDLWHTMRTYVIKNRITHYIDFECVVLDLFPNYSDYVVLEVLKENSSYIERLTKSNWLKYSWHN